MKSIQIINIDNVSIGYENKPIIESLNLEINSNDFWGIVGPNGGGKTTLLKTIIGLITPVKGKITYLRELKFGYVPQNGNFDNIFPVSVCELVMMGRYRHIGVGRGIKDKDRGIVTRSLKNVGIAHLYNRPYRSLSGGEKQRALIARAIAGEPNILILDEPTAFVDIKGEAEIMDLVKKFRDENNLTILMVSHFLNSVSKFANNLILIDKDREIFESGPLVDVINSKNTRDILGINSMDTQT